MLTIVTCITTIAIFFGVFKARVEHLIERTKGIEASMQKVADLLIMQGRFDERLIGMDSRVTTLTQEHLALELKLNGLFEVRRGL